LTRRATIEEIMDFTGDEQDLLSMYLTNGFCLDKEALVGKKIHFHNADSLVRRPKKPRSDRTQIEIHGTKLPPMWAAAVHELYRDIRNRHRFDIIQTILNQKPLALFDMERRIRRWRRGLSIAGDLMFTDYEVGDEKFVIAVHLMKVAPDE